MAFKIYQILWEALSVALLLYGVYLFYAFLWFSISEVLHMPVNQAKLISGLVAVGIILYSSFKWFTKKYKDIQNLEEGAESKD
ncbi:hypothetical protein [Hydrogenothermus marinus]|uniref:Uncharacterized protein n=1 Tax=Hydrogenothermus marinus TaxID=133270 RepID=A0A3M0BM56_9AQUI|nr:hypothetical protein [Hydrogenothermus marinus]RMA97676.1 hypothetical protein CLV39_0299 [Hydrogenothermus marinus]